MQDPSGTLRAMAGKVVDYAGVATPGSDDTFEQWRNALQAMLASREALFAWQDRRFAFAHQVGVMLSGRAGGNSSITDHALYGVFLSNVGPCYIGQTKNARRRLYDLPVGESHHVAATVPPELWERVVVICWPTLLDRVSIAEQRAADQHGFDLCSLALEHLLQVQLSPPLNGRKRTGSGMWVERRPHSSRSAGALAAAAFPDLFALVRAEWTQLSEVPEPSTSGPPVLVTQHGRVVFPTRV